MAITTLNQPVHHVVEPTAEPRAAPAAPDNELLHCDDGELKVMVASPADFARAVDILDDVTTLQRLLATDAHVTRRVFMLMANEVPLGWRLQAGGVAALVRVARVLAYDEVRLCIDGWHEDDIVQVLHALHGADSLTSVVIAYDDPFAENDPPHNAFIPDTILRALGGLLCARQLGAVRLYLPAGGFGFPPLLLEGLRGQTQLHTLAVHVSGVGNNIGIFGVIPALPALRTLCLEFTEHVGVYLGTLLKNLLRRLPQLETLEFVNPTFTRVTDPINNGFGLVLYGLRCMGNNNNIKTLYFSGAIFDMWDRDLSEEGDIDAPTYHHVHCRGLFVALANMTSLRDVYISCEPSTKPTRNYDIPVMGYLGTDGGRGLTSFVFTTNGDTDSALFSTPQFRGVAAAVPGRSVYVNDHDFPASNDRV